jgi:hypothetical protein
VAWPTSPAPNKISVGSLQPTRVSIAQSLKRQVRSTNAQRWTIALSYRYLSRANWAPLLAQVLALKGQFGTTTFVFPASTYDTAQGSWAGGAPQVDGASQVGNTLNIKNLTPSASGIAKAGDFIKFADSKVYMVTADANANGAGKAALSIQPKLIVSPADSEAIVYTSVPFTVMLGADAQSSDAEPPFYSHYDCTLIEAY